MQKSEKVVAAKQEEKEETIEQTEQEIKKEVVEGEQKTIDVATIQEDMEDKLKKNYEDFQAIIEKDSKKEIPLPPKNGESLLKELFKNQIEKELNKVQHIKCV